MPHFFSVLHFGGEIDEPDSLSNRVNVCGAQWLAKRVGLSIDWHGPNGNMVWWLGK